MNSLDLPRPPSATRVVVAMSGGVDSSVVAGLLKRQGYDVIGVTLQLYDHGEATHRKGACCAGQDIHDARRAAERLGIAHYVLDYEERFRSAVIDRFAESYAAGETPVPCAACNQTVKFSDLLETARRLDADALATGHYVTSRLIGGRRALFRPADLSRDQSYFLFGTTQAQLDFLRFPLGAMAKSETRAIARDLGLAVADKPDSQDICFVPSGRYADIIEKLKPDAALPGAIVDMEGNEIGRHGGVIHFTVGQRRGIGIAGPEPLYVVRIDARTNQVVVGPRSALATRTLTLRDVNWLGDRPIPRAAERIEIFARVRSTRPPVAAEVSRTDSGIEVHMADAETGVAPGQACVFYDGPGPGTRVLGGGWIAGTAIRSTDAVPMREGALQETH